MASAIDRRCDAAARSVTAPEIIPELRSQLLWAGESTRIALFAPPGFAPDPLESAGATGCSRQSDGNADATAARAGACISSPLTRMAFGSFFFILTPLA